MSLDKVVLTSSYNIFMKQCKKYFSCGYHIHVVHIMSITFSFDFFFFFYRGFLLKERVCSQRANAFLLKKTNFEKVLVYREANRKSHELPPFETMTENLPNGSKQAYWYRIETVLICRNIRADWK